MAKATIPFAGSYLLRGVSAQAGRGQSFTNCFSYGESDNLSGGKRIVLQKRQGLTSTTISVGYLPKVGSCVWQSNTTPQLAFSFFNGTSSMKIYNQSGAQIGGDIANTNDCLELTDTSVSGTGTLVGVFVDSASSLREVWYYPQGGAWTQITDGDFPPNQGTPIPIIGPPVHLDGYMFIMTTTGRIYNSNLNSVSAWDVNDFITASSMPDGGIGLGLTKGMIVAFGNYSIEFFVNNGNPTGSPLRRIDGSTIRIGAKANSIRTVGEYIYFTGFNSETGQLGFYRLIGQQLTKISTPSIEQVANGVYCAGAIKTPQGFEHILFATGSSTSYAWTPDSNRWWHIIWADNNTVSSSLGFNDGYNISYMAGYDGVADDTAKIFIMNSLTDEYRDDGTALTMTIQTLPVDLGTDNWKTCSRLRLIGDKQSSSTTVTVSWSDDDAVTFTSGVTIDMSSPINFITRLGRFKRRVWKFTNATNTPLRLEAFEIEYEVDTA